MLRRFFLTALTALTAVPLAGCLPATDHTATGHPAAYVGRWVEVLPGSDGGGFELFADGTATSIDQPELNYVSWRTEAGKLVLTNSETVGDVIKITEIKYSAQLNDTTRLHLSQNGADDWPQVFRMID